MQNTLLPIIEHSAMLVGQAVPRACIDDIVKVVGPVGDEDSVVSIIRKAWKAGRLEGEPKALLTPRPLDCPFITRHRQHGWVVALSQNADSSWLAQPSSGGKVRIDTLEDTECVTIPAKISASASASKSTAIIWETILKYRSVFIEALLATFLINILTLATSIYSLSVYDRVIPHNGFQTLYVLTVGVLLAVIFDLILKQVRGFILDKTSTRIDLELSEWFFERAMGIYLSSRPATVGTLASQLKGLEMVRGMLSSASLFLMADVPFAFFFIYIIYLIAGWAAVVPFIFFLISLVVGLVFYRQIDKCTNLNQGQNNKKVGLLVESIDAAEMIKANGAEYELQSRWNTLAAEAAECDDKLKQYAALPSYISNSLSQIAYVALVCFGAYLVSKNQLTMGGLIACSIISGRALSPLGQIPGFMIRWGHAKAAIEGLDKLISLPNEIDGRAHALIPGHLDGRIRMENIRYTYGRSDRMALEIVNLEIQPGEKVGIIGAIGSGKSTFLKLASGLHRPSAGSVFLDGMDMALISPRVLRENIAYLPQDIRLISGTLRDNLIQGLPDPGDEALLEAARKTGLFDLISNHPKGLALPISEGGRGISGGQRQTIGLTRIIIAKPAIFLLDEPTASMDSASEANIVANLKELVSGGETLVVATHKSALLPILDRLLVIMGGKLVIDGPRDLVLAKLAANAPASLNKGQ